MNNCHMSDQLDALAGRRVIIDFVDGSTKIGKLYKSNDDKECLYPYYLEGESDRRSWFYKTNVKSVKRADEMVKLIGEAAMLEQLAEEASELAQAALKKARKIRRENPTPKTIEEVNRNLIEEYSDVVQVARGLRLLPDENQIREKEIRFQRRWSGEMV